MVRYRDPFGLALRALREALRDGAVAPGQPLLAAELAASVQVSVTPVREALSRLAGEGLIEDRRGRGFYALRPGAPEIEELYSLHQSLVSLALTFGVASTLAPPPRTVEGDEDAYSVRAGIEAFWGGVMQRADAGVLVRAHRRVSDQLGWIRLIEPLVLSGGAAELEGLVRAALTSDVELGCASEIYHRRRRSASRLIEIKLKELEPRSRI